MHRPRTWSGLVVAFASMACAAVGANCNSADLTQATPVPRKDASASTSSSSSSSGDAEPAAACTEDSDCTGDPGGCKRWSCNTTADRCEAVSLGDSCNVCGSGGALRVHFYQVSQALAALVDLPDGRHVLVDTADTPQRQYCGSACQIAHDHLLAKLTEDLGGAPIDMLWISHPHSDHIGGVADVAAQQAITHYVDNGRDGTDSQIKYAHQSAAKEATMNVIEPGKVDLPIAGSGDLKLTAIAPPVWLSQCSTDRNACSIVLRLDYCSSSVMFMGDAETDEEAQLAQIERVTLLQVGHHGSDTSSSAAFLAAVQPKYAVISSAKEDEGINGSYCHPRASTVAAVTAALGGAGSSTIRAFDAEVSCRANTDSHWLDVPASDRLWSTARDGDVVLTTTGDGTFTRE